MSCKSKSMAPDLDPLTVVSGSMIPQQQMALLMESPDLAASTATTGWCHCHCSCCQSALVALGKQLVLMHSLCKCLDGVYQRQPSAIGLHAYSTSQTCWSKHETCRLLLVTHNLMTIATAVTQNCNRQGKNAQRRCKLFVTDLARSSEQNGVRQKVLAYHIEEDDEPVESKNHCMKAHNLLSMYQHQCTI